MSIATTAAQQSALVAAAQAASKPVSASSGPLGAGQSGQAALTALSNNFGDFLNMLMTQLKNQDPSSPLDSNQFTQELVSFSGVEQQINTNNSLTQLIQLTQAGELMQGSSLNGKQILVQSDQIPLQDGRGAVQFTASSAGPAAIAIADASGKVVRTAMLNAQPGINTWNWDGKSDSGIVLSDGAYHISVYGTDAGGGAAALPFAVIGTVTGMHSTSSNGMQLQLGALDVGFGAVQSLKS